MELLQACPTTNSKSNFHSAFSHFKFNINHDKYFKIFIYQNILRIVLSYLFYLNYDNITLNSELWGCILFMYISVRRIRQPCT